jgi:lysophospholipase L1-like esterase
MDTSTLLMSFRRSKRNEATVGKASEAPSAESLSAYVTPPLSRSKRAAFSAIIVLLALLAMEAATRLASTAGGNARWKAHSHLVDTLGFPALNQILEPDDTLFWRLRPNLGGVRLGGHISSSAPLDFTVSTDRLGCRLPAAGPTERLIACLGDSCTFGVGVDDEQAYPAVLQARLADARCINLGVPGYSAYQGRRRLEAFPFDRPPRVVIICFGFNDTATWDGRSDLEHARLSAERNHSILRYSRLMGIVVNAFARSALRPASAHPARPRLSDDEFMGELRGIAAWCRACGAVPLLLVWPQRGPKGQGLLSREQQVLQRLGESDHIRVVDLLPVFGQAPADRLFVDVVHASPAGCELAARTLQPTVEEILGP